MDDHSLDFKDKDPRHYFNRELSWLAFNKRVLEQAFNSEYPLLERLRYLSFVSSNLDEFYEIRVAGLMQQVDSSVIDKSIDGLTPKEQLKEILKASHELVQAQYTCWTETLKPALKEEGIVFKTKDELSVEEFRWIQSYFEKEILPVLTPLAIDSAHPFPQLINKGLNILVLLEDGNVSSDLNPLAVIPVPRNLPRIIEIRINDTKAKTYVFLSDLLSYFAGRLFPELKVKGAWEFRITRNSDLYVNEEEVGNLLKHIEEELYKLRRGAAVRLEIRHDVEAEPLKRLLKLIGLQSKNVFHIDGPLNLMRLFRLYKMADRPKLKFPTFEPYIDFKLSIPSKIFNAIAQQDILLHHPYDSFTPIIEFLQFAAKDPKVLAIKLTLYRTSGDSPIVEALKDASRNGKQVTVVIELKARFDEADNIARAKELEETGAQVVYGIPGLKTHCKCCLVIRQEKAGLKKYVHLNTGNYNARTAKHYTDLSLLTTDSAIAEDISNLFNVLTGYNRSPTFNEIIVAPFSLHSKIQQFILNETRNAQAGKPAKIIAKLNSLSDEETINNLYKASQAGVKIQLIVRGICCLVPQVRGLSENIEVKSIVGRFLEHSRIYYFENHEEEPKVFIGSADWMARNFFRRVEVIFPIKDTVLKNRIINKILSAYLKDSALSSNLLSGFSYKRTNPIEGNAFSSQRFFMKEASTGAQGGLSS